MEITILTPTYNRKDKLPKLYKSLCKQTCKNFIWMIIDDGSLDNTEELIATIKNNSDINIIYFKKDNGGKHTALNYGISKIKTQLTFIVDSDDWLDENAIKDIEYIHHKYGDFEKICGYSFLRKFSNGNINGKPFCKDELLGTYIDTRINCNDMNADKAEVWKTKYLKEYPFPEFKGEKFLGEDVVWIQMALKYEMVHVNKAIYVGDYLQAGLTNNRRKANINSPKGCLLRARLCMNPKINIKFRIKSILQYIIYGKFSKVKINKLVVQAPNKCFIIMLLPIAELIYLNWKFKLYKEEVK